MTIVSSNIEMAAQQLEKDEVVAIPTETVYGLAGNIYSEGAIRKIFEVKQRPLFNPLIVHIYDISQIDAIAREVPPVAIKLAKAFWPGPLTLVLKKNLSIPEIITAGKDTVAVRIPDHPLTLKLLKRLSFPLAAPSANPFNRISPTKARHVESYFKNSIAMVLDGGECQKGIESTIVGFEREHAVVLRLGAIAIEDIEAVIGKVTIRNKDDVTPDAPGMLLKHYAPRTKTLLVADITEAASEHGNAKIGLLTFTGTSSVPSAQHIEILSEQGDLAEAASNLYQALHTLDHLNLDIIIAERHPDHGLGKSINDRLERAAE